MKLQNVKADAGIFHSKSINEGNALRTLRKLPGISTRMATRDLKQLVEWGHLAVIGKARATKYFLK